MISLLRPQLANDYRRVRAESLALAEPLTPEDMALQSMPDVSPTKWHLAHTTWFFEQFVLGGFDTDYKSADPRFGYLFNSYYEAVGPRHPRPERGMLSRPSADEVRGYRRTVDHAVIRLIERADDNV